MTPAPSTPPCTKRLFSAMKLSSSPNINVNLFGGDLSEDEDEEEYKLTDIVMVERNQDDDDDDEEVEEDDTFDEDFHCHHEGEKEKRMLLENGILKITSRNDGAFSRTKRVTPQKIRPIIFESPLPVEKPSCQTPRLSSAFPDIHSPVVSSASPLRTPLKTPLRTPRRFKDVPELDASNCSTVSATSFSWLSPAPNDHIESSSSLISNSATKSPASWYPPTPIKSNWAATGTPCT
jgi:hypothetical protein